MSHVTKIDCIFCNPAAGDLPVRRPIAGGVTSEELARLIVHVIQEHMSELKSLKTAVEVADNTARMALSVANGVTTRLNGVLVQQENFEYRPSPAPTPFIGPAEITRTNYPDGSLVSEVPATVPHET